MHWPRAAVALIAAAFAIAAGPAAESPLTVSAAVSLTDALEAVAPLHMARTGTRVRFNFGASNVLARQIVRGAPVDVFVSADAAQMDVVAAAGGIAAGTRIDLLTNRLAIVTARGRGQALRDVRSLLAPEFRRIAIGDPAAVPAGVYARQYLEASGVWTAIAPRIVPMASARAVAAGVSSGAADAGIVYESDAAIDSDLHTAVIVPAPDGPRIVYPAAVMSASKRPEEARRFLDFLRDPEAGRIFRQFKLTPLAAAR